MKKQFRLLGFTKLNNLFTWQYKRNTRNYKVKPNLSSTASHAVPILKVLPQSTTVEEEALPAQAQR